MVLQNVFLRAKKDGTCNIIERFLTSVTCFLILQMSESKQVNPDYLHLPPASFSSCSLTPNPSTATYLANHLPQMEGMPCGQSEGSSGLARTGNDRVAEHLMGLSYLSYPPCLNPSTTGASNHQSLMQQVLSYFITVGMLMLNRRTTALLWSNILTD